MLPAVSVVVEALLLGTDGRHLTYRSRQRVLVDDEHPDQVARLLVHFDGADAHPDGRVLHSTSWRFAAGRIVLTYAALPDPDPHTATILTEIATTAAAGPGPISPSPDAITTTDVVTHACRHLAFLRRTDPIVTAAARRQALLWSLIDAHGPDVAGGLHHPQPRQLSPR